MDFYLDASIPFPVSQALALVRDDVLYPGAPGCPITAPDVKDDEWLAVAGQHGWAVIMRDKHVRSRPGERRSLRDNGVRAFVLTGAGTTRDGARSTFLYDGGPTSRASPESRHHPTCTPSPSKDCGGSSLVSAVEPPFGASGNPRVGS